MSTTPPTELPTWPEFQKQITAQFKPVNYEKATRDKLAKLRQTGSVKAYTALFTSIVLEIGQISEDEKFDRYV